MTWVTLSERSGSDASPLAMLVKDHRTNRLLARIANHLDALREGRANGHRPELVLSRREVQFARAQWEEGVLRGEQTLYDLAGLIAKRLTGTTKLQLVARIVAGPKEELERGAPRIVIEEAVSRDRLKGVTDLTLANMIASHFRYRTDGNDTYDKLYARASFLEFRPLESAPGAPASRVTTRVKANDAIWNKVCDALFQVDALVQRDKILNSHSKYIKDVFGIKVLTASNELSHQAEDLLGQMVLSPVELEEMGNPGAPRRLELVERKDYVSLPPDKKKATGWEAIKNVYRFGEHLFEVQIQTERNYFLEVYDLSDVSHRTFEMQRRKLRRELEQRVPHYREIRHLLKTIFTAPLDDAKCGFDELDWVTLAE